MKNAVILFAVACAIGGCSAQRTSVLSPASRPAPTRPRRPRPPPPRKPKPIASSKVSDHLSYANVCKAVHSPSCKYEFVRFMANAWLNADTTSSMAPVQLSPAEKAQLSSYLAQLGPGDAEDPAKDAITDRIVELIKSAALKTADIPDHLFAIWWDIASIVTGSTDEANVSEEQAAAIDRETLAQLDVTDKELDQAIAFFTIQLTSTSGSLRSAAQRELTVCRALKGIVAADRAKKLAASSAGPKPAPSAPGGAGNGPKPSGPPATPAHSTSDSTTSPAPTAPPAATPPESTPPASAPPATPAPPSTPAPTPQPVPGPYLGNGGPGPGATGGGGPSGGLAGGPGDAGGHDGGGSMNAKAALPPGTVRLPAKLRTPLRQCKRLPKPRAGSIASVKKARRCKPVRRR